MQPSSLRLGRPPPFGDSSGIFLCFFFLFLPLCCKLLLLQSLANHRDLLCLSVDLGLI
ncbi:hypothetical protein SLEP1_g12325 [Rubroshorea leprosula]|uniref:Uncharacterized protein n=1 Tax=Rubroshorea leprosula TaxID=152421 RepID=A0AAV5ILK7_9ROSI|nr:hypothetical protein SLEP1_g12325 [Rubroshorea leprosula]